MFLNGVWDNIRDTVCCLCNRVIDVVGVDKSVGIYYFLSNESQDMKKRKSGNYICSMDNCFNNHYALGLCRYHWNKLKIKEKQNNLWEGINEVDMNIIFDIALNKLSEREKKIITLRFFYQKTLQEIGDLFKVSRDRIRQIEYEALKKMRRMIRKSDIIL